MNTSAAHTVRSQANSANPASRALERIIRIFAAMKSRSDTVAALRGLRANDLKDIGMTANDVDVFSRSGLSNEVANRHVVHSLSRLGNW